MGNDHGWTWKETLLACFKLIGYLALEPVVSTPASYLGGPGYKSLPEDRLSWGLLWFYSVPSDKCQFSP
jgi:hypothetical protein